MVVTFFEEKLGKVNFVKQKAKTKSKLIVKNLEEIRSA